MEPHGSFVQIRGGGRLHVACAGEGSPPVVFESAIAGSSLSWSMVVPAVSASTRTCAYDRAGLGWSDPPSTPRTVDRMVDDLRSMLAAASVAPPYVLVGHSFGAFLVCALTVRYRSDVAGLVLVDPPTDWHRPSEERRRLLRGGAQLSRLGGVLARLGVVRACLALLSGGAPGVPRNVIKLFGPRAARTIERMVGEVRKLPPEVHPALQAIWSQPKCFQAMAMYLSVFEDTADAAAELTSLDDLPLAVISAGDQPPTTLGEHRKLAALSTAGRHLVAQKSDHWIQFDQSDLVIAVIQEIVAEARARGQA